jgi:FkbM family methyltransferase
MSNTVDIQRLRTLSWFKRDGDKTLRLDYDLNEDSLVFDVGGYLGDSTANVYEKFKCNVYVFEPVEEFCVKMRERFKGKDKIKIFNFGLGGKNEKHTISIKDDKSSLFRSVGDDVSIEIKDIVSFLDEHKIKNIDLMEINIEGGEYPLLSKLIKSGKIEIVDNIQVQFHDFVENSEKEMKKIKKQLEKTHFPTFQFEFVWENWKRKPDLKNNTISKDHIEELYNLNLKNMEEFTVVRKDHIETLKEIEAVREQLKVYSGNINEKINELQSRLGISEEELSKIKPELEAVLNSRTYGLGKIILMPFKFVRKLFS